MGKLLHFFRVLCDFGIARLQFLHSKNKKIEREKEKHCFYSKTLNDFHLLDTMFVQSEKKKKYNFFPSIKLMPKIDSNYRLIEVKHSTIECFTFRFQVFIVCWFFFPFPFWFEHTSLHSQMNIVMHRIKFFSCFFNAFASFTRGVCGHWMSMQSLAFDCKYIRYYDIYRKEFAFLSFRRW